MAESPSGAQLVQKEIAEFLNERIVRRRLFPRAVLVGLLAGIVAVAFRLSLLSVERMWTAGYKTIPDHPISHFLYAMAIGSVGTYIGWRIVKFEPDTAGSGIPQTEAALEGIHRPNWLRVLWTKYIGSLITLGSGLALGREGPTVQMGGAIGNEVGSRTGATARERRALTAAGAGAGLAAAFNAPLAGVTFVLEELQRDFQAVVFTATLLSAAVATVVSRLIGGQTPVFAVPAMDAPPLRSLLVFMLVGCVGGLLGVVFNRTLLKFQDLFAGLRAKNPWVLAGIAGFLLGIGVLISPELLGGGHDLSESAMLGSFTLGTGLFFLLIRFVLVNACYGTGVPGGIFAPLLSLGALMGLACYHVAGFANQTAGLSIAALGVAGMCALFSAVVRAPLTGVILIGEMTGSYDLLLPLLMASFCAYMVADGLNELPIYEALLLRFSGKRECGSGEKEQIFARFSVSEESSLVGLDLRSAGLPAGVLVVMCAYDGKEFVPTADTVLLANMKVSAVVSNRKAVDDFEDLLRG